MGRFIVLEGGEGCGKSTQAALLAGALDALLTREPGGTDLAEEVRGLVLSHRNGGLGERAEALLMLAARADHVERVIRPELASGRDVVCDRFSGSTLAYQGWGRGLDPQELGQIIAWATAGLAPDLNVLLQVAAEVAAERMAARQGGPDRMERSGEDFFTRVNRGFAQLAAADPGHWVVVDGSGDPDQVHRAVLAAVTERLG